MKGLFKLAERLERYLDSGCEIEETTTDKNTPLFNIFRGGFKEKEILYAPEKDLFIEIELENK